MNYLMFSKRLRIFFLSLIGYKAPRPKISLLIPFSSKNRMRRRTIKWLIEYWRHELPEAEIVIGRSRGRVFCKGEALNDAMRKATGRVIVIIDSDAYIEGQVLEECADKILEQLENNLWYVPYRHLYRLTECATEIILDSNPYCPVRLSSPPPPEMIESNGHKSKYGHRYGAMCMMFPREAYDVLGCFDERFCVDTKTEIFTTEGWKSYKTLRSGDNALTLNHQTGKSEWKEVQTVNVFTEEKQKMLSMESRNHSSLSTPNHRWPVVRNSQNPKNGDKYQVREFKTSETFNNEDLVPISAKCNNLPIIPLWSNALVELIAWFWTEGHIYKLRDKRNGNTVSLSQSISVNPEKCERIKKALTEEFGEASEFIRQGRSILHWGKQTKDIPRWNEKPDKSGAMVVDINAEGGKILQLLAPNKVPSYNFLLSLTQEQLDLFIEISIMADGCNQNLAQKNRDMAEAFQFACILAGHGTSMRERSLGPEKEIQHGYKMNNICIRSAENFKPSRSNPEWINYEGGVWCPTLENSTWLARRNGTVYFTGNTGWGGEDIALLRALDTLFGKHKTTENDILHLWHPFIGEDYKTRRWEGQSSGNINNKLASKYNKATGKPEKMRRLVNRGCNSKKH